MSSGSNSADLLAPVRGEGRVRAGSRALIRSASARNLAHTVTIDEDDVVEHVLSLPEVENSVHFRSDENNSDFTSLRYTAVRSTPSGFARTNYHLRHVTNATSGTARAAGNSHRAIRNAVCVSVDASHTAEDVRGTLRSLSQNVSVLSGEGDVSIVGMPRSPYRSTLVVLMCERPQDLDQDVRVFLTEEAKLMKQDMFLTGADAGSVNLHMFERTFQPRSPTDGLLCPLQVVVAFKAGPDSAGKLRGHHWFFQGFCTYAEPETVLMLDAGVVLDRDALPRMLAELRVNPQLGACCGELVVWPESVCDLFNPVIAAQVFEYKMAQIMPKTTESLFGYVAHMPGAFTLYRYSAISPDPLRPTEACPLQHYLAPVISESDLSPMQVSLHAAGDQMLAFEMLARRRHAWQSTILTEANATVRPWENVSTLVEKRSVWRSGSFFGLVHFTGNIGRLFSDGSHSAKDKAMFAALWLYQSIMLLLNWFLVGVAFETFRVALSTTMGESDAEEIRWLSSFFQFAYLALIAVSVVAARIVPPRSVPRFHAVSSFLFGILGTIGYILAMYSVFDHHTSTSYYSWMAIATLVAFLIASLAHWSLLETLVTLPGFLWMLPSYVNTIAIHAFAHSEEEALAVAGIETAIERQATLTRTAPESAGLLERDVAQLSDTADRFKTGTAELAELQEVVDGIAEGMALRRTHALRHATASKLRANSKTAHAYSVFSFSVIASWVVSNLVLVGAFEALHSGIARQSFLAGIFTVAFIAIAVQLVGSVVYAVMRRLRLTGRSCCRGRYVEMADTGADAPDMDQIGAGAGAGPHSV